MLKSARLFLATIFAVVALVCATSGAASAAGPLSISVTRAEAGDMQGPDKQAIIFWFTVKNTSQHEYISRLESVRIQVSGRFGNRSETYERDVKIDWQFDPALGPRQSKSLRNRFFRKVDPRRNMFRYDDVKVKVLRYNFRRTS